MVTFMPGWGQQDERLADEGELQVQVDGRASSVDQLDAISEQTSLGRESEEEENYRDDVLRENGWVADATKPACVQQTQEFGLANGMVLPSIDPPEFGDVSIKNSKYVHLGNKTFYKGPVTIKQFIYSNPAVVASTVDDIPGDNGIIEQCDAKATEVGSNDKDARDEEVPNGSGQTATVSKKEKWYWTWKLTIFICAIALIVLTTTILLVVISSQKTKSVPLIDYTEETINGPVAVDNVRFVSRIQWGAQPADEMDPLKHPVPYVLISHTATETCDTQAACVLIVRYAQTYHMSSMGWGDIGYNFLVGGDGLVYIGRSWDNVGAHTFGFNNRSIGISFIGTYIKREPTKQQLEAAQNLIKLGVKRGKIAPDYKLLAHCQAIPTESPGLALYKILKTWSHWFQAGPITCYAENPAAHN